MPEQQELLAIYIKQPPQKLPLYTDFLVKKTLEYNYGNAKPEIASKSDYAELYNTTSVLAKKQQLFLQENGCKAVSTIFSKLEPKASAIVNYPLKWVCDEISNNLKQDIKELVAGKIALASSTFDDARFNDLITSTTAEEYFNKLNISKEEFFNGDFLRIISNYDAEQVEDFKKTIEKEIENEGVRLILREQRTNFTYTEKHLSDIGNKINDNAQSLKQIKLGIKEQTESFKIFAYKIEEEQSKISTTLNTVKQSIDSKNWLEFQNLNASVQLVWLQCGIIDSNLLSKEALKSIESKAQIENIIASFDKTLKYAGAAVKIAAKLGLDSKIIEPLVSAVKIGNQVSGIMNSLLKQDYIGAIMGVFGFMGGGGPTPEEIILDTLNQIDKKLDYIIDLIKVLNEKIDFIIKQNETIIEKMSGLEDSLDSIFYQLKITNEIIRNDIFSSIAVIDNIHNDLFGKVVSDEEFGYKFLSMLMENPTNIDSIRKVSKISSSQQLYDLVNSWRANNRIALFVAGKNRFSPLHLINIDSLESGDKDKSITRFYNIAFEEIKKKWGTPPKLYTSNFISYITYKESIVDINFNSKQKERSDDFNEYNSSLLENLIWHRTVAKHAQWLLKSHMLILHSKLDGGNLIMVDPSLIDNQETIINNSDIVKSQFLDAIAAIEIAIFQLSLLSGYNLINLIDDKVFMSTDNFPDKEKQLNILNSNRIFAYNRLLYYINQTITPVQYKYLTQHLDGIEIPHDLICNKLKINNGILVKFKGGEDEYIKYCNNKGIRPDAFINPAFINNEWFLSYTLAGRNILIKLPTYEQLVDKEILHYPGLYELRNIQEDLLSAYHIYSNKFEQKDKIGLLQITELMRPEAVKEFGSVLN